MRIVSTDPNRSNSGFMFAGLAADILSEDVATTETVRRDIEPLKTIFARMGYMASSSGKLFEDYLVGGMGAYPLVVGYESQLLEWSMSDSARWQRIRDGSGPKPVMLYPQTDGVLRASFDCDRAGIAAPHRRDAGGSLPDDRLDRAWLSRTPRRGGFGHPCGFRPGCPAELECDRSNARSRRHAGFDRRYCRAFP